MDFQLTKLDGKPVVVFEPSEQFKLRDALPIMIDEVSAFLDGMTERVFYIPDMRKAKIALDDIFLGIGQVALGDKAFLRHRNVREILLITKNPLIKKAAGSLASGLYGDITLQVFDDLTLALAYVEQRLNTGKLVSSPDSSRPAQPPRLGQ